MFLTCFDMFWWQIEKNVSKLKKQKKITSLFFVAFLIVIYGKTSINMHVNITHFWDFLEIFVFLVWQDIVKSSNHHVGYSTHPFILHRQLEKLLIFPQGVQLSIHSQTFTLKTWTVDMMSHVTFNRAEMAHAEISKFELATVDVANRV